MLRASTPLTVFIPGIGGSELKTADGRRVVWGYRVDAGAARPIRLADLLTGSGGDLWDSTFDDQVKPSRVLAVPIPGLTRVMGSYHDIGVALKHTLGLGSDHYMEFAYDWRRPISMSARCLAVKIDKRLGDLKARTGNRPKVIIVAHSMGGLVARHYLEHHGPAADDCAWVMSLGTPYLGAVKALHLLVNGPFNLSRYFPRLADRANRIPAFYQLLPKYRCVTDERSDPSAGPQSAADLAARISGLDGDKVRRAWQYLDDMDTKSIFTNRLVPVAGRGQPTYQQAILCSSGALKVSKRHDRLAFGTHGGDGTVPLASAKPTGCVVVPHTQTHMGLAQSSTMINKLMTAVLAMRDGRIEDGPSSMTEDRRPTTDDDGFSVEVADYYGSDEGPVVISGSSPRSAGRDLSVHLISGEYKRWLDVPVTDDGTFRLTLGSLETGLHRLDFCEPGPSGRRLSEVVEVV
jgi:pimeloyl-ACP methyl ester carboxylesterase